MRDDSQNLSQTQLAAAIEQQRGRVIDLEAVVDSTRRTLTQAVTELQAAVRERDRAVEHLQQLIAWHEESAAA